MVKFFSEASVFSLSVDFLLSRISWLVLFISSPGSSCCSPGAIPWTGSSTCGRGVHWDGIGHRETAHWVKITLLIDEWPKMATQRVQGEHLFTHSCVTQEHLIEPFPAIPTPDTSFKLSLYTAIFFLRVSGVPDVPGHLYVRKAWRGCHRHIPVTEESCSLGSCFHLPQH